MTKFLYFDLGNVLVQFDNEIALANLAKVSGATREEALRSLFDTGLGQRYERGAISTAGFCETIRRELDTSISDETICLAISDMFSVNSSVISVVTSLRSQQFPIGILSNTCQAHWDFIKSRYSFTKLFPVHALSFKMGTAKPDSEIYQMAAKLAGVAPKDIYFTDDLPANVEAAKSVGFEATLFTTAEKLASDLRDRGISA